MLGVAVGSHELKIVLPKNESAETAPQEGEAGKEEDTEKFPTLPYNIEGLKTILAMATDGIVAIAGNYSWAKPLAYVLRENGVEVRYIAPRRTENGKVSSQARFLQNALKQGVKGRPFSGERIKRATPAEEPAPHPWIELVAKHALIMNDLRQCKHRMINSLRIIFPELISLGNKLWGKKALEALEKSDFAFFQHYGLELEKSLASYVPQLEKDSAHKALRALLKELRDIEQREDASNADIERLSSGHAIVEMFPGSDSARRLALLIGWRNWGSTKPDFRKLRGYAGLRVSRVDSKGNPRISRERPQIRNALFFLLRTAEGERIIAEAEERLGREKMPRPKRMEILLKEIWKRCLQGD